MKYLSKWVLKDKDTNEVLRRGQSEHTSTEGLKTSVGNLTNLALRGSVVVDIIGVVDGQRKRVDAVTIPFVKESQAGAIRVLTMLTRFAVMNRIRALKSDTKFSLRRVK